MQKHHSRASAPHRLINRPCSTANLFSHWRYAQGASTTPDAHVFAHAGAQVKTAMEVGPRSGGGAKRRRRRHPFCFYHAFTFTDGK